MPLPMQRQEFRLALHHLWAARFELFSDAGMQFLTPGAQQRVVRGILHQGMFERVHAFRRCAACEQEASIAELIEYISKLRLREVGDGRNQVVRKLAPNGCTSLGYGSAGTPVGTCRASALANSGSSRSRDPGVPTN